MSSDPASPGGTPNTVYGFGSGLLGGNSSLIIAIRRFLHSLDSGSMSPARVCGVKDRCGHGRRRNRWRNLVDDL